MSNLTSDTEHPPEETTEDGVTDIDPNQEVLPLHYTITSYGADFLIDGLVNRVTSNDIRIPTFDPEFDSGSELRGFQRDFVWTKPQADRFLESLLLGMPVPGIFLVREPDGVLLVLDGHQRLKTLHSFYSGLFRGKEYRLEYAQQPWFNKTYRELDDEDRRRLDDSILHATILRQDHPQQDYSAVYSIFERINTGGTPLHPQEIRAALFGGPFIGLIRTLNSNKNWRKLYGSRSTRLKDQELILRFFAFFERADKYHRPVKGFLNDYLSDHRYRRELESAPLVRIFEETVAALSGAIGSTAFRPVRSLNAAVLDSVMVAVARRITDRGEIADPGDLRARYERLLVDEQYVAATESSTAAEESVSTRLTLATQAFRATK